VVSHSDEKFHVFISHKDEDRALAKVVHDAIESISERVECFVSSIDITAGMDWRNEIRTALTKSHLLILLFTAPSKHWDWCLYETGLYTRFDRAESRSVVCLFNPADVVPSPLANLQGVPADKVKLQKFFDQLSKRTWELSDDWRFGALKVDIDDDTVEAAAEAIELAFDKAGSLSTYYPCHRIVLSLHETDDPSNGIPEGARVREGPADTSSYTMSLFSLGGGTAQRTWGDLLRAADAEAAEWRKELDEHFKLALREQLFPSARERLRTGHHHGKDRFYSAILYSIVRGPAIGRVVDDGTNIDRRPRELTILLHPEDRAEPVP
jgi:hypothetical protein